MDALLHDADVAFRRRAALTFAERGDARGEAELVSYWAAEAPGNGNDSDRVATGDGGAVAAKTELSFEQARILLAAMRQAHLRSAAPVLVRSLGDVRLRADIAATLGVLGVKDVAPALLAQLAEERYVSARAAEAEALVSLGAREELRAPLERFAGVPEPLPEVLDLATRAGLLVAPSGWRADAGHAADGGAAAPLDATLGLADAAGSSEVRLLLAVTRDVAPVHVAVTLAGGAPLDLTATVVTDTLQKLELHVPSGGTGGALAFRLTSREPVVAAWLVRHAPEIPPPPPRPWHPVN